MSIAANKRLYMFCKECKKDLDESKFPKTPKGNFRTYCKDCFKKKKYMWQKAYIEKIGGVSKKNLEPFDKFKVNPVPLLESKYWNFTK